MNIKRSHDDDNRDNKIHSRPTDPHDSLSCALSLFFNVVLSDLVRRIPKPERRCLSRLSLYSYLSLHNSPPLMYFLKESFRSPKSGRLWTTMSIDGKSLCQVRSLGARKGQRNKKEQGKR